MNTREDYQQQIETKLEELSSKVWMVKQKADETRDETKVEYTEFFKKLHLKLENVEEYYKELKEASEDTWQNYRAKVDGAMSDLNNSIGNILSRIG